MNVVVADARALVIRILSKTLDKNAAEIVGDGILFAELSGRRTHGLMRLLPGHGGPVRDAPSRPPEIKALTPLSALVEGHGNPAMFVAALAVQEAIAIGTTHRIAVVGTRGTRGTSGCLSYFLEKAVNAGFIAIGMASTFRTVVPHNGLDKLFGTNPIAIGVPAKPLPMILDMSTAATTFGEIFLAKRDGRSIRANLAIDKDGRMTEDPSVALEGGVLPLANSYQASGLALAVELLAGALTGASYCGTNDSQGFGQLFVLISPHLMGNADQFLVDASRLIDTVVHSRGRGGAPIRIPGQNTLATRNASLARGTIDVSDSLWNDLQILAQTA